MQVTSLPCFRFFTRASKLSHTHLQQDRPTAQRFRFLCKKVSRRFHGAYAFVDDLIFTSFSVPVVAQIVMNSAPSCNEPAFELMLSLRVHIIVFSLYWLTTHLPTLPKKKYGAISSDILPKNVVRKTSRDPISDSRHFLPKVHGV